MQNSLPCKEHSVMTLKQKLHRVIFETSTPAGRRFDVVLLWLIVVSVIVVMLESVPSLGERFMFIFLSLEWGFTIVFTVEYILRIWSNPRPARYIFSFWGFIDLLSILPTYLSHFFPGYHYFLIIRIFRLLRVFRIMKIPRFHSESQVLARALKGSSYKIGVFFWTVLSAVVFMGTLMYVVEGGERGFTSIPQSIYWAIVTITTVGYGDMVPSTIAGKIISSFVMITGYAIIAVPTGIITVEMSRSSQARLKCPHCDHGNEITANYCNQCGNKI